MKHLYVLLALLITFSSCKKENTTTEQEETSESVKKDLALTVAETIAIKNGYEHWKDVSQIDFTFNVDRGGKTLVSRVWSWRPKTDDVTMRQNNNTVSYNRKTMDSTHLKTDASFINDKYWLLAPFNMVWDEGTTITLQDTATAPISQKPLKMLTLTYGEEGGYTPGDAYDFYYDNEFMVQEWVFRKGNQEAPSMMTTWEDYTDYNGIKIAQTHMGPQGDLKLHFTDVRVKMK